jgi:hypothetical protein
MSHDLLVYGGGDLCADTMLVERWLTAARHAGVELELHPRFEVATHGGYLPLRIELGPPGRGVDAPRGPLRGGVELFFEFFDPPATEADGELTPEQIVERATFCAMFQISESSGQASGVAAVVGAAALASATAGVVLEEEQGRCWTPPQALQAAERYLEATLEVEARPLEGIFEGWESVVGDG